MPDLPLFEAELVPHRSLSPRGIYLVLGFLGTVSFSVTLLFWYLGAWPIAGFNGGEMLLAAALLRTHARSRRVRELLSLSEGGLRIVRYDINGGRSEVFLPAGWLNIDLVEKPGRVPGMFLTAPGQREEVARALGEPQKRDFAEALRGALHQLRHPVFNNPQLDAET
jgi:uncharacterized membrane protein